MLSMRDFINMLWQPPFTSLICLGEDYSLPIPQRAEDGLYWCATIYDTNAPEKVRCVLAVDTDNPNNVLELSKDFLGELTDMDLQLQPLIITQENAEAEYEIMLDRLETLSESFFADRQLSTRDADEFLARFISFVPKEQRMWSYLYGYEFFHMVGQTLGSTIE